MSTSKCPECGKPSTGNFCQHCGAKLGGRFCNKCGAELGGGARFCNLCGEKVAGGGRVAAGARREAAVESVGGQNLPWWIAGAAMFALIVFIGVRMVTPTGTAAPAQPTAPIAGGPGTPPDISQMSPREAADRLFDRVMRYVSANDSVQAQAFLPMALGAYERAQPLDHDGLFHLSLLNRAAGNLDEALANAQQVLAEEPNHVLALAAAAEAASEMGDRDAAMGYYRQVLDVIDAETARGLPEYLARQTIMESVRSDAEAFLGG